MGNRLIGTSLAFAVRNLVSGEKKVEDVDFIVTGTKFQNVEEICKKYSKTYWAIHPNESEKICRELWNQGKIIQPALENDRANVFVGKLWYTNLDEFIKAQNDTGRYICVFILKRLVA